MSVPCQSCTAKCCKNYDVFIDHEDLNISDNLDFIKKIPYSKSYGYVPKFILILNNPDKTCQFLVEDKCSIYDNRPLICRTYPHYVENDKIKVQKNICPIQWKLDPRQIQTLKNDYQRLLVNFLAFETICDQWNKIVTKEDNLEKFLIFVKNYKFHD